MKGLFVGGKEQLLREIPFNAVQFTVYEVRSRLVRRPTICAYTHAAQRVSCCIAVDSSLVLPSRVSFFDSNRCAAAACFSETRVRKHEEFLNVALATSPPNVLGKRDRCRNY